MPLIPRGISLSLSNFLGPLLLRDPLLWGNLIVVLIQKQKLLIPLGPDQPFYLVFKFLISHDKGWYLYGWHWLQLGLKWGQAKRFYNNINNNIVRIHIKMYFSPPSPLYRYTWGRMCAKMHKRGFSVGKHQTGTFSPPISTYPPSNLRGPVILLLPRWVNP